jgi:hypothetical protein
VQARPKGLGLDSIAVCLDAGVDPAGLVGVPAEQAGAWPALAQYLDLARRSIHSKKQEHA